MAKTFEDNEDYHGAAHLWKPERSSDKAPVLKGKAAAHRDIRKGEILGIAFWKAEKKSAKSPYLTGTISDVYVKENVKDDIIF